MNTPVDPERRPLLEGYIGSLQWNKCYFGPKGAIAIGERYFGQFLTQNQQTRLWAILSIASLYYSAATSSWGTFKQIKAANKFNLVGMIQCVLATYSLLKKAWRCAQAANHIIHNSNVGSLNISSQDYDVMQTIARAYYRILIWNKPHGFRAKVVLGFAAHSISVGLKKDDCTDISRCLLLIGHTDLMYLQIEAQNQGRLRIAIFDTLLEVWDITTKITVEADDLQTIRQLSRVFRHITEMCGRLPHFLKELMPPEYQSYPSSADELGQQANALMLKYLEMGESADQRLKARMSQPHPSTE
jgi:hypothetical protein